MEKKTQQVIGLAAIAGPFATMLLMGGLNLATPNISLTVIGFVIVVIGACVFLMAKDEAVGGN